MFHRLTKRLDEIRCRTLLGQTAATRGKQIHEGNPAMPETEAEQIANREAVASLRAEGVDATSLSEVTAWSKRFLTKAAQTKAVGGLEWNDALRNCDFMMTADEIRDMLKIAEEEANAGGVKPYYKQEFLDVLYPFIEKPAAATAIPLLQVAPFLRTYFEKCSPGGDFYEMRRLLGER